jgi:predicted nucleotidyltransferase
VKIVGLIAEYNPLHNGHLYHIQKSKEITGADHVVIVMSGEYVQRGIPAIMPKSLRAEMAIKAGASAVFEIPLCYATGTAELFALGSVSLLNSFNCVDSIVFGSECNNIGKLSDLAHLFQNEPLEFKELLQQGIKEGLNYPAARTKAVAKIIDGSQDYVAILKEPNNILGIEYIKALNLLDSPITPLSISRKGAHEHDATLHPMYSSATAIRSLLAYSSSKYSTYSEGETFINTPFSSLFHELDHQIPDSCIDLLKDYYQVKYPIYQNDFSLLLKYKLINKTPKDLFQYMDVSMDLANRICKQLNNFFNYKQFGQLLKTKEITHSRINRALLHIMLGLKKKYVTEYRQGGYHFYTRLLGLEKGSQEVVSTIAKKSNLPMISNALDSDNIGDLGKRMLYHDTLASNLYNSVVTDKFKTAYENEYSQRIVKV